MLSSFVARSKRWIQLTWPVITFNFTSDSSPILFSHLCQMLSLYPRVKKWGTQQAANLHIFNFSLRIVYILTDDFEISRAWTSCQTVMWQTSRTMNATVFTISSVQMLNGHPTWGSNSVIFLPSEKAFC